MRFFSPNSSAVTMFPMSQKWRQSRRFKAEWHLLKSELADFGENTHGANQSMWVVTKGTLSSARNVPSMVQTANK
jgi:hypothetical protein